MCPCPLARREGDGSAQSIACELQRVSQHLAWPLRTEECSDWPWISQLLSRKCAIIKQVFYLLVLCSLSPLYHLIISIRKAHTPLVLDFRVIHCNSRDGHLGIVSIRCKVTKAIPRVLAECGVGGDKEQEGLVIVLKQQHLAGERKTHRPETTLE